MFGIDADRTTAAAGSGSNGASGGIRRSAPTPSVVVTAAKTEDVPILKYAVATVEPVESVVIRPQADGVVVVNNATDGQMVKAGDILFKLDDKAIQATIAKDYAALAKDQANLDAANQDLAAARDLVDGQIDSNQQAYQAEAAVKALEASIAMDKAQLQADQVQLATPRSRRRSPAASASSTTRWARRARRPIQRRSSPSRRWRRSASPSRCRSAISTPSARRSPRQRRPTSSALSPTPASRSRPAR